MGTNGNDTIYGDNGDDLINGCLGDDLIYGGRGNDILDGVSGSNTFVFETGDGNDIIVNSKSKDSIRLYNQPNIRFSHDMENQDLVLNYGKNDSITLKDYFTKGHSVQTIRNGSETLTLNGALDKYGIDVTGTNGDDLIKGTGGNDIIMARYGNDIISGGKGNDVINGGDGDDTYLLATGDGNDIILGNRGKDVIRFASQQTLTYSHMAGSDDLVISYGNNDSATLVDYFTEPGNAVKGIQYGSTGKIVNIEKELDNKGLILKGTNEDDMYKISLDRHYTVQEQGGTDTLRVTKDINMGNRLHILFDVESTYTLADGINFGDVCIVSNKQLSAWTAGDDFKGVVIENNAVENILVGGRQMSSTDVAQLAADVAGWLSTNGFASVQDVLNTGDATNINALIAEFQANTNWNPIQ